MKRRAPTTTLAVVDLGSNAVRLQIADAQRDGTLTVRARTDPHFGIGAATSGSTPSCELITASRVPHSK